MNYGGDMMACEICDGKVVFYFKKSYASSPYSHLMRDWGEIEYVRCEHCGFVHAKESDLPFQNWEEDFLSADSTTALRFWEGFFRIAIELIDKPSKYDVTYVDNSITISKIH